MNSNTENLIDDKPRVVKSLLRRSTLHERSNLKCWFRSQGRCRAVQRSTTSDSRKPIQSTWLHIIAIEERWHGGGEEELTSVLGHGE